MEIYENTKKWAWWQDSHKTLTVYSEGNPTVPIGKVRRDDLLNAAAQAAADSGITSDRLFRKFGCAWNWSLS